MNNQIANEMSANANAIVRLNKKGEPIRPYIRKAKQILIVEEDKEVSNVVNVVDKIPEPVEELVVDEEEEDDDKSSSSEEDADEEEEEENDDDEEEEPVIPIASLIVPSVSRPETQLERLEREQAIRALEIARLKEYEQQKTQVGTYRKMINDKYRAELIIAEKYRDEWNAKVINLEEELQAANELDDDELLDTIRGTDKLKEICIPKPVAVAVAKVGGGAKKAYVPKEGSNRKTPTKKGDIRIPSKIFKHREVIRHSTDISTWEATYDKPKDEFVITKITGIDGKVPVAKKTALYAQKVKGEEGNEGQVIRVGAERVKNPNQFIVAHNSQEQPSAVQKQAPWSGNTQLFRDGDWISIGNLPVLNA